jgi:hypothetical protein
VRPAAAQRALVLCVLSAQRFAGDVASQLCCALVLILLRSRRQPAAKAV